MKTAKSAKNGILALAALALALLLATCNNFFHDLIPPDGNRIVSFHIDAQIGAAEIGENTITVQVSLDTEIDSLLPQIGVSDGATLFPITDGYLRATFPGADIEDAMLSLADDPASRLLALIRETPGFNVPKPDIPIDFTFSQVLPVYFLVLSGRGSVRTYAVKVVRADPAGISDFRFDIGDNRPSIAATAVAKIADYAESGTITVKVMYDADRPTTELIPRFVTPGTARVNGEPQVSGVSRHDFSSPVEYAVTSPDGNLTRTYVVETEFVQAPKILGFRFSADGNPGAVKVNAEADIDDEGRKITIRVGYGGNAEPSAVLKPDFEAQGTVTVGGVPQVSGITPQNFGQPITYVVTNETDSELKIEYAVDFKFTPEARISSFSFRAAYNAGLDRPEVAGKLQPDGSWLVLVPEDFGVSSRDMTATFEAIGNATVGGVPQISDVTSISFAEDVFYTVTSINGLYSASYAVTVREVPMPRIFVDARATGRNDGTSWKDAFVSLADAANAAAGFPADVPKEVWIAAGTYGPGTQGYVPVAAYTAFMGGFYGDEATPADRRNPEANMAAVSGGFRSPALISGDVGFEYLRISGAANGIQVQLAAGAGVRVLNVESGGMIYVDGGSSATFTDVKVSGSANHGIAVRGVNGPVVVEGEKTVIENPGGTYGLTIGSISGYLTGDVRISGITVNGARSGIDIWAANVTIDGVKISGAADLYGISVEALGTVKISNSAVDGGGMGVGYCEQGSISEVTVNGGLRLSSFSLTVSNSIIKGGSINLSGKVELTDVKFINCLNDRSDSRMLRLGYGPTTFLRCQFIHDDDMKWKPANDYDYTYRYVRLIRVDKLAKATFEDCDFVNLLGDPSRDTYIFSRWAAYENGADTVNVDPVNVELKNCRFTFRQGERLGLVAGFAGTVANVGSSPDNYLFDNVSIADDGTKTPIFWLWGANPPGTFRFRPNNRYKAPGTADFVTLDTPQSFGSLGDKVKLDQGAFPTIVP